MRQPQLWHAHAVITHDGHPIVVLEFPDGELGYGQITRMTTKKQQYATDEEDSDWPPQFCQGCGFAIPGSVTLGRAAKARPWNSFAANIDRLLP